MIFIGILGYFEDFFGIFLNILVVIDSFLGSLLKI
jgi:hypothetical protein